MLPGYRQAPDYETAVKQKYNNNKPTSTRQVVANAELYSSQPDIHLATHLQQVKSK